jgi:hypothetical protein
MSVNYRYDKNHSYKPYNRPIKNLPKLDDESKNILQHISNNLYLVVPNGKAPLKLAIALARFGKYIQRECHYDFSVYDPKSICPCSKDKWATYLFVEDDKAIGSVVFNYNFYSNLPEHWCLTWAWIAPEYRRKGLLTTSWLEFLKKHSPFVIQYPLSDSMESFKEKASNKNVKQLSNSCSVTIFNS